MVFSFLAIGLVAQAQAPVESLTQPARSAAAQPAQPDPTIVLYNELQQLREEVLRLTGRVEELSYEVQRLQSAQANDYANLDARILDLSRRLESSPASAATTTPATQPGQATVTIGRQPQVDDEAAAELYAQSLDQLRAGERAAAIQGFEQLISRWPNDALVADSYYWIGQTRWVAAEYEGAREAFTGLVTGFPEHRKYAESLFRLGQVYLQLNDSANARKYLEMARDTGSAISSQAEQALAEIDSN